MPAEPFIIDSNSVMAIIAVAAIFSPLITAVINGLFQVWNKCIDNNQRKYETEFIHKRQILENYIQALETYLLDQAYLGREKDYQLSYSLALLYIPAEYRDEMKAINEHILLGNFDMASTGAYSLIPKIAEYINKSSK